MQPETRRLLTACGVVAVVACVCLGLIAAGAAGVALFENRQPTRSVRVQPTAAPEMRSPTPTACAGEACPTQSPLPPETARQMDDIEQQVSEIRGLQPSFEVNRALLTPEELRQRVLDDFFSEYTPEEAADDARIYEAFHLLPPGFDLLTFLQDLYSEQIAGFFDNETKEMYVVQGEEFRGPQRMTYSHEYTHFLQDQNYDFKNWLKWSDETCEQDTERCTAVQSLIEGDATLTEQLWFIDYATPADQSEAQQFAQELQSPVYDSAPAFMKEDFLFPYLSGMEFVQTLYDQDGFASVDEAFVNPPVSTEQIMHPDRYPDDKPREVSLPDLSATLGAGWGSMDAGVVGEWYTLLLLTQGSDAGARLDEVQGRKAAAGWGGDAYAIYEQDGGDTALVIKSVWDSDEDAAEFEQAFQAYADMLWGGSQPDDQGGRVWHSDARVVMFQLAGDTSLWVEAPDADTAAALIAALR